MGNKHPCIGCFKPLSAQEHDKHICPVKRYIAKKSGLLFAQCVDCKAWPCVEFQHHCIQRVNGVPVDLSKKRWEPTIQAWVLDFDAEKPKVDTKRYDAKTRSWQDDDGPMKAKPEEKEPEPPPPVFELEKDDNFVELASEQPPDNWSKKNKGNKYSGTTTYYGGWRPTFPWDKIDRKLWPTTWWALLFAYHAHDWYKGKWISEPDWKARLNGEYRPEPEYSSYHHAGSYGPYWEGCD